MIENMVELTKKCKELNELIKTITISENFFNLEAEQPRGFEAYRQLIEQATENLEEALKTRLNDEYFGDGPLRGLLEDAKITEVIINSFDSIWIEEHGQLRITEDTFLSEHTFGQFLQRLYLEIGQEPNLSHPFLDSSWHGHRLHLVCPYSVGQTGVRMTLRKHKKTVWSLAELQKLEWANRDEIDYLQNLLKLRKNFLVIGPTGSGKTSVLKALFNECKPSERVLVLEDSKEIDPPTASSTHLLTRHDSRNVMSSISLTDLVRQSLRMRPDRIIVGEVRGGEAKDLLMALATGHEGSAGTLHAADATQAVIRLEMLVQMGAPQWSLVAIRRLIQLSLDYLIVCQRSPEGERRLEGIYKLISVEDSGLIIERIRF